MDINLITKSTQIAELKNFLDTCQDGIDTMIGEFGARISGGQRQRIGIARAIYSNSNFLIFDEATSAIDFETEKKIIDNLIKLPGKTMIIISHRRSILEGNKILKLKEDRLVRQKMIKNLIKEIDKRYCFNTIKKIKSEFDQLTRIVFHKRFVKKIMNKTDHNNISILNNNRNNILSELL